MVPHDPLDAFAVHRLIELPTAALGQVSALPVMALLVAANVGT